jgi:hypothetical protein
MSKPKPNGLVPSQPSPEPVEETGHEANNRVVELVNRALSVPKQGTRITLCPTSLDLNTIRGKALMLKASSPGDYDVKPGVPIRLIVCHWAVIPDTQVDEETGELHEFVRTVLYDAEGKTFRTSSAHSPMRLCAMLELFSPAEWANGIPVIVVARQSKRGRVYHDVEVDLQHRFEL